MRTLLFTGKGGVGKTTVAAATALRCADAGLRTLAISTDPAHSLADAFDHPLKSEVAQIAPNLFGQQLDGRQRMEESWDEIRAYLLEVFAWAGVDDIEAEELAVVPGLDELFALTDINQFAQSGEWDVLVIVTHYAGALVARDVGDSGPDMGRRFQYAITHDRATVVNAARSLLSRLLPN